MTELLHDTHFWVLIASIVFAGVAFKKGKKPLIDMLDGRTTRIQADLQEAARLRREAEELLADSQRKHRDAVQTGQKIIDNARTAAEKMQKDAESKLSESLKQRESLLLERIARAESAAVQEVRIQAADIAARAAEKVLLETLAKNDNRLIDESIKELSTKMN